MRMIQRVGGAVGIGVAVYGGVLGTWEGAEALMGTSTREFNTGIQNCAAQLGTVAVRSEHLPKECEEFLNLKFAHDKTVVDHYDPETQEITETSNTTMYSIPPAAVFLNRYIITPQADAQKEIDKHVISAGFGVTLMVSAFGYLSRRKQSQ